MCVRTCESPVSHAHAMPPPSKRKPLQAVALIVAVLVFILLSIAAPSLIAGSGAPRAPPARNTPPQAPHLEADRQATIRAALAGEAANIDPKDTDFTLWHEYAEAIADQPVCPGHPDFKDKPHAKCHLEVVVDAPCLTALELVHGRVHGKGGWTDCKERPAGGKAGLYSGDAWLASRITGNGEFTDKLGFRFNKLGVGGVATGTCKIVACSERQVDGKTDYSNNFCNLQNLYGHESGLKVLELDVTGCPQHDVKECCKFRDQKRPSLFTFGR